MAIYTQDYEVPVAYRDADTSFAVLLTAQGRCRSSLRYYREIAATRSGAGDRSSSPLNPAESPVLEIESLLGRLNALLAEVDASRLQRVTETITVDMEQALEGLTERLQSLSRGLAENVAHLGLADNSRSVGDVEVASERRPSDDVEARLRSLDEEFDSLVEKMREPAAQQGLDAMFNATPDELHELVARRREHGDH